MENRVIIMVDEEELIVSLYHDYIIRHNMGDLDTRLSVKLFSDYIQQYLIDRYNLDEEETNG